MVLCPLMSIVASINSSHQTSHSNSTKLWVFFRLYRPHEHMSHSTTSIPPSPTPYQGFIYNIHKLGSRIFRGGHTGFVAAGLPFIMILICHIEKSVVCCITTPHHSNGWFNLWEASSFSQKESGCYHSSCEKVSFAHLSTCSQGTYHAMMSILLLN